MKLKSYTAPELLVVELDADASLCNTSNIGISREPVNSFDAPGQRPSDWDDYEQ